MLLAWENFWEVLFIVLLFIFDVAYLHLLIFHFVVVSSFDFQATLPCHWHSTLASQAREGLHQLWALPRLPFIASSFSSTASATVLSGRFLPTGVFYLKFLPDILEQPAFIKASLGAVSYFSKFAGLHTDLQNTDPTHLFVWFTVIHNLLYILSLYLCMSILQKFYLWWKLW